MAILPMWNMAEENEAAGVRARMEEERYRGSGDVEGAYRRSRDMVVDHGAPGRAMVDAGAVRAAGMNFGGSYGPTHGRRMMDMAAGELASPVSRDTGRQRWAQGILGRQQNRAMMQENARRFDLQAEIQRSAPQSFGTQGTGVVPDGRGGWRFMEPSPAPTRPMMTTAGPGETVLQDGKPIYTAPARPVEPTQVQPGAALVEGGREVYRNPALPKEEKKGSPYNVFQGPGAILEGGIPALWDYETSSYIPKPDLMGSKTVFNDPKTGRTLFSSGGRDFDLKPYDPNFKDAVSVGPAVGGGVGAAAGETEIPTLTPEQAKVAAPGTKYRTTDGRVRVR